MASRSLICLVTSLAISSLPGAALRTKQSVPFRQMLGNLQDLQYFGDMSIGAQKLKGILDTGSFEIVTFSSNCPTCGIAGKYDEKASKTYRQGSLIQEHAYGSGSCTAGDAFDSVSIGADSVEDQPLWLATECQMPLLRQASFQAIVGLGPPGQPEYVASKQLQEIERLQAEASSPVSESLRKMHDEVQQELRIAQTKHSLLENLGVDVFSTCLGKAAGSPGWLIWKDHTRENMPGVHKIPVVGNITWGVKLADVSLLDNSGSTGIGCQSGCGAIVDTGTSLFAVPSEMYDKMVSTIVEQQTRGLVPADCSDLRSFPDLVMNVGGQELRFPPSSYIGKFYGQAAEEVSRFIRTNGTRSCELLLMDLGSSQKTSLGPMVILGMPFFRQYYTTFELGERGHRNIFVSNSDDSCNPVEQVSTHAVRSAEAWKPRWVDASKLRVPHWAVDAKFNGM